MKIITWNSRGWKPDGITYLLAHERPDILCIQESGVPVFLRQNPFGDNIPAHWNCNIIQYRYENNVISYNAYLWINYLQQRVQSLVTYVKDIHQVRDGVPELVNGYLSDNRLVWVNYSEPPIEYDNVWHERPILKLNITLDNGHECIIGNAHGPANNIGVNWNVQQHTLAAYFIHKGAADILHDHNRSSSCSRFFIGDFNLSEDEYRRIYPLNDANQLIFHIPRAFDPAGRIRKIDYMITNNNIPVVGVQCSYYNNTYGSDHSPVIYTL